MATLVIKNLPEELHAALKARAERHRRSLTKEAVTLIETALAVGPRAAPALPPPIRTGTASLSCSSSSRM